MKTPEEIKHAMMICSGINGSCAGCEYFDGQRYKGHGCLQHQLLTDAMIYVNYLEEHADAFYEMIPQWIGVKDSFPEDDGRYLVWTGDRVEIADYWGDGEWANHDYGVMVYGVTHWMKLPKMPINDWA